MNESCSGSAAEKINGVAFDNEALEVEPQSEDESDDSSSPSKEHSVESSRNESAISSNLSKRQYL